MEKYEIKIGYFYPELLNLYGDHGNVLVLNKRCRWRGISVVLSEYTINSPLPEIGSNDYPDIVFMGGGPDRSQLAIVEDLSKNKEWFLKYAQNGGVGLFICGAYQLLGNYYQDADGNKLLGIGLFDVETRHFGKDRPRCIGNILVAIEEKLALSRNTLVGFENHGGRTYLGKNATALGKVVKGFGNNGEDKTEGARFNNCFGTYLHGPLLPKNPHFADLLIYKALKHRYLSGVVFSNLNDNLEWAAHDQQVNKLGQL
jgi:CobQ-like glutamine amidotransferase family enzyme